MSQKPGKMEKSKEKIESSDKVVTKSLNNSNSIEEDLKEGKMAGQKKKKSGKKKARSRPIRGYGKAKQGLSKLKKSRP